jgi:hypothetical protein
MALVSPGQQITISDESQYVPGAVGSVPLIILATAQDKTNPSGATASGTIKANAGKLQMFTGQRDLVGALGYPTFKQSSSGTPLHGDERNEYGLMAAYSTLGLANKAYVLRADIDIAQLDATAVRPTGTVANGTNWLDLAETDFGAYEWNATTGTFTKIVPTVLTSADDLVAGTNYPVDSVGSIGSYAVALSPAAGGAFNGSVWNLFYKNLSNIWTLVGSDQWATSNPTVKGTITSPTLNTTDTIYINAQGPIALNATTLDDVVSAINAYGVVGVTAANVSGHLELYASAAAASNGTLADGKIVLADDIGAPLAALGVTSGPYANPAVQFGTYVQMPNWRSTDAVPRPSKSVFIKTTATGAGANVAIKKFSASTGSWVSQAAPLYNTVATATYGLDPAAGGFGIAAGTIFVKYNVNLNGTVNYKPYVKATAGATKVVANITANPNPFTSGETFTLQTTSIGTSALTTYTITINGTGRAAFAAAVLAADIPEVTANVESTTAISLTHKYGGAIVLSGAAVTAAGFTTAVSGVSGTPTGALLLSAWVPLSYTYSTTEPTQNPVDGTLWYYGSATEVDVMINTLDGWKGYQQEASDARGYDLSQTDPTGVIVSASKPTSQTDSSALVAGDLWLDTSDLENWPAISRYTGSIWVKIDNKDQISQNGIIFADARWGTNGTVNVINGDMPSIASLATSDYLDADAPDARLYPRGTLLFNTRRSGYNVKRFVSNYFNDTSFPDAVIPAVTDAWVSASGLKNDGSMYAGHQAQRHMIVAAMKGAVDGSTEIREEQFQFNLIVAPGYPELIANMVALNNDRVNTAFVIGDTPMRLAPNGIDLANWSNNSDNATGLTTNDPYLGVYYPGCAETNDVQGNAIIQPASHIALRTFIHSDNMSYMWFAPAGTRRGLVDNASSVGYIDSATGEYNPIGVNQGLRDTLYENKINPITNLPGIGLVVWGQKTRNPVASSMDRVNVARLVNYIRTILATVGNGFLFEPNDKITRDQIKNIISGAINDLVAKRGVYDYLVVCDESNNTPTRIARNELYVDVAIEPMKDVEFIYIPIRLYNPGDIAKL